METPDIVRFLHAIDEELAELASAGEIIDFHLIGRSALILRYGVQLATKDVDLVIQGDALSLQSLAFERFGKGTPNAQKWGLFLEAVPAGLPPVPGSYRKLSTVIPGQWRVIRPKLLDPHHLAVTKLHRFHAGDREDLRILCDSGDLTVEGLRNALAAAHFFGLDEEEDPRDRRILNHFARVIAYLEGLESDL